MASFRMILPLLVLIAVNASAEEANSENRQGRQYYPSRPFFPFNRQFASDQWPRPWYFYPPAPQQQPHLDHFEYESRAKTPATSSSHQLLNEEELIAKQSRQQQSFLASLFDTTECTDPNGLVGRCVPSALCSLTGGRPATGSCSAGRSCCVQKVSSCGGQTTRNNTYWESLPSIRSGMSCSMTVTLDQNLIEQYRTPICQVRLDFLVFKIEQPGADSKCSKDSFIVGGASNVAPVICGENPGQHMYLNVPPTTTAIQLLFNFGQTSLDRSWNIKIALLPCGADYLAPTGCIQYFTSSTGIVKSYNWKDWAPSTTAVRQLANQDLRMCFRTEMLNTFGQDATKICYSPCTVTVGRSFAITGNAGPGAALSSAIDPAAGACQTDFLLIPGGGQDTPTSQPSSDRYCGTQLNPTAGSATDVTVCTTVRNFHLIYRTDDTEPVADIGNLGFCLNFEQRAF